MGTRNFAEYNPGAAELGRKNQPGGYVGIDGSGDVIGTFAQRVDTEANLSSVVLANGELAYASDTQSIFVGDGVTAGGLFLHQAPQVKTQSKSGLVSKPSIGAISAETSLLFPVSLGAIYAISGRVWFSGDTSNTSNFALSFSEQASAGDLFSDFSLFAQGEAAWYDNSDGLMLESINVMVNSSGTLTGDLVSLSSSHQNLSSAWMSFHRVFDLTTNPVLQVSPYAALTMCTRTGTTSAASGKLVAICRRIS